MKVYKLKEDLDKASQLWIEDDAVVGRNYIARVVNVRIPDGVTCIAYKAFEDDDELKSIIIPASVTKIMALAFAHCTSLKSVTIQGKGDITLEHDIFIDCHKDLIVKTNNKRVINYCKQNGINYRVVIS